MLKNYTCESFVAKRRWSYGSLDWEHIIDKEFPIQEGCIYSENSYNDDEATFRRLYQSIIIQAINDAICTPNIGRTFNSTVESYTNNAYNFFSNPSADTFIIFDLAGFAPDKYIPLALLYIDKRRNYWKKGKWRVIVA